MQTAPDRPANPRRRRRAAIAVLTCGLALSAACATSPERNQDALLRSVQQYNNNIRWERPERAQPLVTPELAREFRDWSEGFVEDYDIQDWKVREMTFLSPTTAEVEIQRRGFHVRKLLQEEFKVLQTWSEEGDDVWRLQEGF